MVLGGAVDSQDDTNVRGASGLYPWIPGARSQWGWKRLGHKPQQGSGPLPGTIAFTIPDYVLNTGKVGRRAQRKEDIITI